MWKTQDRQGRKAILGPEGMRVDDPPRVKNQTLDPADERFGWKNEEKTHRFRPVKSMVS